MARFYVNRGGGRVPEGPFEEQQIVKLIHAGKLKSGHVSAVGSQRFSPLASHPPFAQALADAGVVQNPADLPRVTLDTKNTSRGLLLGAVMSIFGLALAAVAIGAYVMFQNGGMPIRGAVPTDTELLIEVKSVPRLFADWRAARMVNAAHLPDKQFLDDTAQAFTDSFGVPKAQTKELLVAASSVGFAARKVGGALEGGVLLSFSNATPVNAFLSSRRFKYTGLVAKSGRKYALSAGTPPPSANVDQTRRALIALASNPQTSGIVWFETSKVLFVGSPSFAESVARVVSLDVPSLEQSPTFKTAQQDLPSKPNVDAYLDPSKLAESSDPTLKALFGKKLEGAGPVSASLEVVPAGLLSHFVARVVNGGPTPSSAAAAPLTVVDRLPAETFAYVAATTHTDATGAELEQRLLDELAATSPELADRARTELAHSEELLHVKPSDLLGALGDQAAVAVLAPPNYALSLGDPSEMRASFALVYVQALKDEAPARAACNELQTQLGAFPSPFSITADADGYLITTKVGGLRARIRFASGTLFVAVGGEGLVERSLRAFSNAENTLGAEPAQHAARSALPSAAQVAAWVDLGRVVDTLQKNPLLALAAWHPAFGALQSVYWTGPDRVTTALTITSDQKAGTDTYRVDALNLPIAAFLAALGVGPHR